ncbi:neutral trehalase [Pelagibius litoralis]|uniref:Neutral trehalase n=1 Tax=Pelagibius litoralis TaxID=374515 RepID=A0A967F2E8_9PROT|nr:trehalase family glycosidase [Pelagibius litoralis]NIA71779.1 neutral trehalase [Pelagibius litoralis]
MAEATAPEAPKNLSDPEVCTREAERILKENDRGGYTVPTPGLYPFQWNWDSCFVALGWATFDEVRAWQEIDSLFAAQWPDGMVPHIAFHREDPGYFPGPDVWGKAAIWGDRPAVATSGISDPPVAASIVLKLWQGARDRQQAGAAAQRLYPKLMAWHRWFHGARDPAADGMVAILHPWESGRDNSPDWDTALSRVPADGLPPFERRDLDKIDAAQRPRKEQYDRYLSLILTFRERGYDPEAIYAASAFKMVDVGTLAILLRADRDLRVLAEALGHQQDIPEFDRWIARGEDALERLWDEEAGSFRSFDLVSGTFADAITSASFLPLYAGGVKPERLIQMIEILDRWFATTAYPVPSFDPEDQRFDRLRYWRGPTWAIVNHMIAEGLSDCGYDDRAARIAEASARAIRQSGFWEYFDPITGQGLGGDDFTWTAAMWLAWARHFATEN